MSKSLEKIILALQEAREKSGYTRKALSKKMGRYSGFVGQIERGDKELTLDILVDIFNALELKSELGDWFSNVTNENFLITSGDLLDVDGPSFVERPNMNQLGSYDYYSLLDPKSKKQEVVTDFQMLLVKHKPQAMLEKHFHWGEEFTYTLSGSINCYILSTQKSGNREPVYDKIVLNSDESTIDFIWFRAWLPHYYEAEEEGGWGLHILMDPRGEGGLFNYTNNQKNKNREVSGDHVHIIDEDANLSYDSIKTGVGIRLKKARLIAGMSTSALFERCQSMDSEIKINPSLISRIENSEINPSLQQLILLSKALDIKIKALIPKNKSSYHARVKDIKSENSALKFYNSNMAKLLIGENVNSKLEITEIRIGEETDEKLEYFENDVAVFIITGILKFKFWDIKGDNPKTAKEKINKNRIVHDYSRLISQKSTVYVKKNRVHALAPITECKIIVVRKTS